MKNIGYIVGMKPGDRLLCAFVDSLSQSATFSTWPLHITVIPWFRFNMISSELSESLSEYYVGHEPFIVYVKSETVFGYTKRKTVNLVFSPFLQRLEGQSRRFLHTHNAWIVDEADHTRRTYKPHVTVQGTSRVHEGEQFICNQLCIVSQQGGFKQVDEVIRL